ncbi:MAG: DNA polymerase IV, partial [Actinomycetes bacterium]
LARAEDDRPVVPDRGVKSVSHEETFERDLTDLAVLGREIDSMAARVGERLRTSAFSGRTVTLKLRRYDFTTITRSQTLPQPTDDARQIATTARRLLIEAGTAGGLRLLGVGVSGLSVYAQGDLFADDQADDDADTVPAVLTPGAGAPESEPAPTPAEKRWWPGQDVRHDELGPGWVWGRGLGRVTVRFEGPLTLPGPVRTLAADDPALSPAEPPDWRPAAGGPGSIGA